MSDEPVQQRVTVAVRVRPKKNTGQERYDSTCVGVEVVEEGCAAVVSISDPQGKVEPTLINVDKAFDDADDQEVIYQELVKDAVVRCMGGEGDAVFVAYGQTGSGKTYTMLGEGQAKPKSIDLGSTVSSLMSPHTGVLMRIVQDILHRKYSLESTGQWHCVVVMAAVEVYNESFHDLLVEGDNRKGNGLEVREFEDNLLLQGLSRINVLSAAQAQKVFQAALRNRSVAFTNMNDASSRSHAIFSTELYVQRRTGMNPNPPDVSALVEHVSTRRMPESFPNPSNDFKTFPYEASKVTLVDLAGSERIKKSGVTGKELLEAVAVNKSLSALGKVVHQLCLGTKHIPFRESKLTKYMQASFSNPKSSITFITNVSPASSNYSESINSLRFASRLKELKVVASSTSLGSTNVFEEDSLLKRSQVRDELAADLRIAQAAGYKMYQARLQGKLLDQGRLKSTMNTYSKKVRDVDNKLLKAEVEKVLSKHTREEADAPPAHSHPDDVQEVAPDTARNRATSAGVVFKQKPDAQHLFIRTELEFLDEDGIRLQDELEEASRLVEDAQEQSQLGNKLLAMKADLQRSLTAIASESKIIDEQLDTLVNPHTSDNAFLKAELGQDVRSKTGDDQRHARSKALVEKLIALNTAKIDVLETRVKSMTLRDNIEQLRMKSMTAHSGTEQTNIMIDASTVAGCGIMDMSKVVELCKTRIPPGSTLPAVDGADAFSKLMDERLTASDPRCDSTTIQITHKSRAPRASPVSFYFSPSKAVQISRQLLQNSKMAHPEGSSDHQKHVDVPVLFESHFKNNTVALGRLSEAVRVWILHSRALEWFDSLHTSKQLTADNLGKLYTILDEMPLQYGTIEHIIQRARRRAEGTLSGSDEDDSGSGSGSDSESPRDFGVSTTDTGAHRNVFDGVGAKKETARSTFGKQVVAKLIADPSMRNSCILRCLQVHSLLGLHDKFNASWYTLDPLFDDWCLDGCLVSNPIQCILREVIWRARLHNSYTRGPAIISTRDSNLSVDVSQRKHQDALQSYIDSVVAPDSMKYLCFESSVAPRLKHGRMRDLSPIAFYACRVLDATSVLSKSVGQDSIPHTPSSVRFVEAVMLCCGYGSNSSLQ